MKHYLLIFFILLVYHVNAQEVYKTPSGKKYHLASCRMVKNASKKLLGKVDISKHNLSPCKICKPPKVKDLVFVNNKENKSVGLSESVQCKGTTKKGTRCKHKTKIVNGYCYQHTNQNSTKNREKKPSSNTKTSLCGARTKSGKPCKRKVKGGGFCYQHK